MQIDRSRFLALVGALATSCASGTSTPKTATDGAPSANPASASASPSASASASSARPPPAVAGPHLRTGPCVEGGIVWPRGVACDDKLYEVDCAKLAPPGVCGWATKLQRQCERYAKYVRPGPAATWIEGYACMFHGDRRAICKWQEADLHPSEVIFDASCRRADEADVCARLAKSCAALPASHPQFVDGCRTPIGMLSDAGVAKVDACLKKNKACSTLGELQACVQALGSLDDE